MKRFVLLAACGLLSACSSGETTDPVTPPPVEAGADAGACDGRGQALEGLEVLVDSEDDATVKLSFVDGEPMPPIVGNNVWSFRLQLDGEPLEGAASDITVTPFMPDHGHGTPTAVNVAEVSPGTYRFAPVHTRMAGYWEIGVEVEHARGATTLTFGVCVE